MSEQILQAADYRRAGLILRYTRPDEVSIPGVNSVIQEAHQVGRGAHLLLALAGLNYALSENLHNEAGQAGLAELVLELHDREKENETNE